eukprot:4590386-Amphidinium_carterae.1
MLWKNSAFTLRTALTLNSQMNSRLELPPKKNFQLYLQCSSKPVNLIDANCCGIFEAENTIHRHRYKYLNLEFPPGHSCDMKLNGSGIL